MRTAPTAQLTFKSKALTAARNRGHRRLSGCKNQDHISAFLEIGNRTEADVSPELSSGAQTQHAMALAQSEYVALQLTPFCVAIKLYSELTHAGKAQYSTIQNA